MILQTKKLSLKQTKNCHLARKRSQTPHFSLLRDRFRAHYPTDLYKKQPKYPTELSKNQPKYPTELYIFSQKYPTE